MPCGSAMVARSRSTEPAKATATLSSSRAQLFLDSRPPLARDRVANCLEHRAQAPVDLDRARAVLADLGDRERDDVVPAAGRDDRRSGRASLRRTPSVARSVLPIMRSVSPRWSSTWTAVVGSLTAGESARFAMSTMTLIPKAGSWSIVRSLPRAIMLRSRRSTSGNGLALAVDLEHAARRPR